MAGINIFSKVGVGQTKISSMTIENPSPANKRSALSASTGASGLASPDQKDTFVSFSLEALKLLEVQKEARDKALERMEVRAEKFAKKTQDKQALDQMWLDTVPKASKTKIALARLGEIKSRLKQLKEQLESAMVYGDKRTALAVAKELSQLAKEAKAIKASLGGAAKGVTVDNVSVPNIDASGDTGGGEEGATGEGEVADVADMAQPAEVPEDVENVEEVEGSENIEAEQAAAEADALGETSEAEAEEALSEDDDKANDVDGKKEGEQTKGTTEGEKYQSSASKLGSDRAKGDPTEAELRKAFKEALKDIAREIRSLMKMAKTIIKQKSIIPNNPDDAPAVKKHMEKELKKAEGEMERALIGLDKDDMSIGLEGEEAIAAGEGADVAPEGEGADIALEGGEVAITLEG
jgi:hypothetical protein